MSSYISFTSLIKDESLVKFIEEDKPVRSTCLTFSTTTTTLITTSSLTDSRVKLLTFGDPDWPYGSPPPRPISTARAALIALGLASPSPPPTTWGTEG